MRGNGLTGTGPLVRLILRRDRLLLTFWVLLPIALAIAYRLSLDKLLPTAASIQSFAATISPAEVAILGRVFAPTLPGIVAWRWGIMGVVLIAIAGLITVVRHTRSDEEAGRRELLGSTVVGRQAPLAAALAVMLGVSLATGALAAASMVATGLPATGSAALGLEVAAVGVTFAAIAGVTAQLFESPGGARGAAIAVLGLTYLLRAIGDGSGQSWASWLSPLGWASQVRPYAGEQWWVFLLFAGAIAALLALSFALSARRDLGAGLLPDRPGPAEAAPRFRSALALAWRLQRGSLLAWTAGFAVLGLTFGFVARTALDQFFTDPNIRDALARVGGTARLSDAYLAVFLMILTPFVAAYAVMALLKLRSEETESRGEPVLATGVGRLGWAASHLAFALIGPGIVLVATGLAAGASYGQGSGNWGHEMLLVLAATLAYLPAVWVMTGIGMALFGLWPRLTGMTWVALLVCVVIMLMGKLLQLSQSVMDLSPFSHVPNIIASADAGAVAPLAGLSALAVALIAAGLIGFRHRNIG